MDERNNLPQELTPEITPEAVPEAAEDTAPEAISGAAPEAACGGCAGCGGNCPHSEAAAAAEAELEAAAEEEAALEAAVDDALAAELLPESAGEEAPEIPAQPEQVSVVDIHFRSGGKVYYFDPDGLELKAGDHVIMDTARGAEYGICASGCHLVPVSDVVSPLRKVLRVATAQDEKIAADNREKEKKAYSVCLQKIRDHKLDMQLVSAECAFDGSKILFFFTADGRVDFRELVKNLASVFRTRIELRQIGVRDKAKMVGGLGVCGRPFCCAEFLDDFQPVSIKMAKTQNLSLNPTKISGTCGRLMCCLKYEQEAYEDLLKTAPKNDSFVDTPDGRGTVCDVNLLRQTVKVRMEDHPETMGTYRNTEIAILRNGKARKNDPPIPRDLAPISGGQSHPVRRQEPETVRKQEDTMPMLFRKLDEYANTPSPVLPAEPSAEPEKPQEEKSEHKSRRSRRRRKPKNPEGQGQQQPEARTSEEAKPRPQGQQKPRGEKKPQGEKKSQNEKAGERKPQGEKPAAQQPSGESGEQKPRSSRRRRRRPRGHGGQGSQNGQNGGSGSAPAPQA